MGGVYWLTNTTMNTRYTKDQRPALFNSAIIAVFVISLQAAIVTRQVDEKHKTSPVSIHVQNTEDDHYHSTDSGIQVLSYMGV